MSKFTDWHHDSPEGFTFLARWFDIQAAKKMLSAMRRPARVDTFQVSVLTPYMQLETDFAKGKITCGISAPLPEDNSHIDLSVPCIWVDLPDFKFMVDGWTRLQKAHKLGVQSLPCVCLSRTNSKRIFTSTLMNR